MHIAFSVFNPQPTGRANDVDLYDPYALRLAAYHTVCKKYAAEIKAIQQKMPGWQPAFQYNK